MASPPVCAIAIGLCCLAGLGTAAAEEVKLRAATFVPDRVVHVREVVAPWVARVNAALDGETEITLFAGGALGRDGEMQWRLLKSGVSDITWFPTGYENGRFPAIEIFEFPLLSDDPIALTIAFWRLYERGLLPGLSDHVRALALSVSPAYHFHLAFPIDDLGDLEGRKIRVVNRAQSDVVAVLGATAVAGVSATQVAESLSRNLIDGALFSWHGTRAVGIELVTEIHIVQPVAFSPSVLIMNKESYAALSPHARAVIDRMSGEALSIAFTASMIEEAESAVARVRAQGHHFYRPSSAERQRFEAAFEALGETWRRKNPDRQALLTALRDILAEIEEERVRGDIAG